MRLPALLSGLLLGALALPGAVRAQQDPAAAQGSAELARIGKELRTLDDRLLLVEKQYVTIAEPNEIEQLKRRYSDAEIQFLLTNYPSASVLIYDLLGSASFRAMPQYPSALYLLGESLYQQQNFLGARIYFREHMNLRGDHFRDSLSRYLEISGRLNEFSGIDQYIDQAKGPGGTLPADVAYVYGKWLFRRTDLSDAERITRARETFAKVAESGGGLVPQAFYFLGVLDVQSGDLPGAAGWFEKVRKLPAKLPREKKLHELALMALGRVYFELGDYATALERYAKIDYTSEHFGDALYESAWTHVRLAKTAGPEEYQKANMDCEKLLLAAADSVLAPEARILQGHLLLKLRRYSEATDAYTAIINSYLEVYDNIDGRLKAHPDPVKYFQKTISESGKTFDIAAYLPPIAVKWATTQQDVAEAVRMTDDIDASRKAAAESDEIVARLIQALDKRALELFPQFQDGHGRAEAIEAALAKAELDLLKVEEAALGPARVAAARPELEGLRRERVALEQRLKDLPKTDQEIELRKAKMVSRIRDLDAAAFRLGYQVHSLQAMLTALERFVNDTRDQRAPDPEAEKEFADRMKKEHEVADQLQAELESLQKQMRDEKTQVGMLGTGDAQLRAQLLKLVDQERAALGRARGGTSGELLRGVDEASARIEALQTRTAAARTHIQDRVAKKAEGVREKVRAEAELLQAYQQEVAAASSAAQDLVGTIAYESFLRVRRQFYELVLKADVGLVDVAWTRKQEKTQQIQGLARQKEKELKDLDEEFKEALKEVN